MPTKLLIVEDHPLFANALCETLRSGFGPASVVQAGSLTEAHARIEESADLELVLLGLWLPDVHGFEGLLSIRARHPHVPVVVLSAFSDPQVIHRAMLYGAQGFIAKSAAKQELVAAVRTALDGETVLPEGFVPPLEPRLGAKSSASHRLSTLTVRQLRVLQMMCQGMLNKQIAHVLDVGETTVKAHVSEVLRKLSVTSRTQAVIEVSRFDLGAVLALYAEADERVAPPAPGGAPGRAGG